MKYIIKRTLIHFAFLFIVTQIIPKYINTSNDYNIFQIIFLLFLSIALAFLNKHEKNKENK